MNAIINNALVWFKQQWTEHRRRSILVVVILAGLCIPCLCLFSGGDKDEASAPENTAQPPQVEATAVPDAPTEPPEDTPTPEPTNTLAPTNTPQPTDTPAPTATPTPLPEPVLLSGSGASVVDLEGDCAAAVAHIVGNAAGRHFAVKSFDADGNQVELLVNTTDPYEGFVPVDWAVGDCTTRLQIEGVGAWSVEIVPALSFAATHYLWVPGTFEGSGDSVVFLIDGTPDLATITGNAADRHFAVYAWGERKDLLVNTTEPYEGTVIVRPDTVALEIKAVGDWSVAVTE